MADWKGPLGRMEKIVKGWHLHTRIMLNYAVVSGMIKLVLYDSREDSPTNGEIQEIFTGEDNSFMLPSMVIVSLIGIILVSVFCRFFNPQKSDFEDRDRI